MDDQQYEMGLAPKLRGRARFMALLHHVNGKMIVNDDTLGVTCLQRKPSKASDMIWEDGS